MANPASRSGDPEREEAALGFPPWCVTPTIRGGFVSLIRRVDRESLSFRTRVIEKILILQDFATTYFIGN
jgi:hypothetical protein